jgi:hypothetical protein
VKNDNETTLGIDARRQRTGNRNELLALEQAIVDRELIELVTGGCVMKSANSRKTPFGSDTCGNHVGHGSSFMKRICGGQTDEPDRA